MELAKAIEHAKKDLHRCRICQDYTTGEVCKNLRLPKTGPQRHLRCGKPAGYQID